MRVRVTTALGFTALTLLTVPACSTDTTAARPATVSSTQAGLPASAAQNTAPLSSAALKTRLLIERDLGSGYLRKPERSSRHDDDVTVVGCPALNELDGNVATGGSLTFPRKAKATFTYTGGNSSEVTEELYSDSVRKLSESSRLVRLAKIRWRIEHDYRDMKHGLGLEHFEGRTWRGWHHHVTLVTAAHAFLTLRRLDPKAEVSNGHIGVAGHRQATVRCGGKRL
ncbi:transposase [Streptomyces sp. JV185]|uniref:transposase n=1 Tax=Streptomyces sp. JV185 TaxID=858638 RepID=UPI002E7A3A2B|nr:transposase [Streptomyces sp. JV185]MEE1772385.1 transposase [Streptomyces sp. JV185]